MRIDWADVKDFVGDKIGAGSFATIYDLPGFSLSDAPAPLVLKRYKRSVRPATVSLDNVAGVRDGSKMTPRQQEHLERVSTWPVRVVTNPTDPSKSAGVIMRRIPERFFFEWRGLRNTQRRPRELQFAIQDDELATRIGVRPLDLDQRLRLVGRLARALVILHERDVVYGDLSMKNIIYDDDSGDMMLVDCDSALRIGSVSPFDGKQPHTQEFIPPESAKHDTLRKRREQEGASRQELDKLSKAWARQTQATDVYKFALVVVRMFDYGAYRSFNRDPAAAASKLPGECGGLLRSSLSEFDGARPSIKEWSEALNPKSSGKKRSAETPQPDWAKGFRMDSSGRWSRA